MPSPTPSALDPASFHSFGDLLRYLRRRAQITQRDLSIAVGYNFAHISRLEQGQRSPDATVVAAVFVPALGVENEAAWAQRLIELAEVARREHHTANTLREAPPEVSPSPPTPPRSSEAMPLLTTKLYVPRPRPDLVPRPRLTAHLNQALAVPLTVIAAPAGFGKTTLLAAWIAEKAKGKRQKAKDEKVKDEKAKGKSQKVKTNDPDDAASLLPFTFYLLPFEDSLLPFHVAWLSLDPDDNDLAGFMRYLVAALQTIAPTVGSGAVTLLQAPQPPDMALLVRVLLNDLVTLPEETLLVLDDYHLITTPAIHTALGMLLDHLPPMLHLVIATRADPPLPLARLRARGQLVEVRAADVRFTAAEAATFLTETMGLPLSADDIAALETRTEGWIAGLQLAALAMRNRSDLTGFISAFTGSNRFVTDYLVTEVFARQPAHLQAFLLQTSILDRLCGPLCDAVMGVGGQTFHPNAAYTQALLEELERTNLFLVPLDDERRWYRYHHLFGAMLRERLLQGLSLAEVTSLHRRAGAWFVDEGLVDEALHHALVAGNHAGAAALVEDCASAMLKHDDFITLRRWLDALPEQMVSTRPRLCLARARLAILAHDLEAAARWLDDVDQAIVPSDQQQAIWAEALTIKIQIYLYRNELPQALDLSEQALAIVPADNLLLRTEIIQRKASALLWNGQLSAALSAFDHVRQLSEAAGDIHMMIASVSNYSATLVTLAQLHAAERHAHHYIQQFAYQSNPMPVIAALFLEQAEIYYEWNDLDRAARAVEEARVRCEQANLPRTLFTVYLIKAAIASAKGETGSAQGSINDATKLVQHYHMPIRYAANVQAAQVKLWMQTGNLQAAQGWANTLTFTPSSKPDFFHIFELLAWVRVLIAQHATERASTILEYVQQHASAAQQQLFVIQTLVLQALVHSIAQPGSDEALALLERALVLTEPEGFVRLYVDEGELMAALLRIAHQRGIAPAYTARLLVAFPNL